MSDEQSGPGGRPTKFTDAHTEQVRRLALLGLSDKEMAAFFEVAESTFYLWQKEHPEFSESLRAGKLKADANVANSLYERALGYSHPDVDIRVIDGVIVKTDIVKHYPPDERSVALWLTNRQKALWRQKIETGLTDKDGNDRPLDPLEAARAIAFLLAGAEQKLKP